MKQASKEQLSFIALLLSGEEVRGWPPLIDLLLLTQHRGWSRKSNLLFSLVNTKKEVSEEEKEEEKCNYYNNLE